MESPSSSRPSGSVQSGDPVSSSFFSFFNTLPSSPELVRFFERSSEAPYYTCHGENAHFIAREYYKTNDVLKGLNRGSESLASVNLSASMFRTCCEDLLLNRGLRVEVYSCSGTTWSRQLSGSPGVLDDFEEILQKSDVHRTMDQSNSSSSSAKNAALSMGVGSSALLAAVSVLSSSSVIQKSSAVSFFDRARGRLCYYALEDTETLRETEAALSQVGVKECLIMKGSKDETIVERLLRRCGILVTKLEKVQFSVRDINEDLYKLLTAESDKKSDFSELLSNSAASSAVACLIRYLKLNEDARVLGTLELNRRNLAHYVKLNSSAIRALGLFPDSRQISVSSPQRRKSPANSLFDTLNQCMTAMGSRLLAYWIKHPLVDISSILSRQSLVELFVTDSELRVALRSQLKALPDLQQSQLRLQKGTARLTDILQVYRAAGRAREMATIAQKHIEVMNGGVLLERDHEEVKYRARKRPRPEPHFRTEPPPPLPHLQQTVLVPLQDACRSLAGLLAMAEELLDLEALQQRRGSLMSVLSFSSSSSSALRVRPSFHPSLSRLQEALDHCRAEMAEEHLRVSEVLGMEQDRVKLERHPSYGLHFRITRTDEKKSFRAHRSKFRVLSTQKAGVLFLSSALAALAQRHRRLTEQYQEAQRGLAERAVDVAASYVPVLRPLGECLAKLDALLALSEVAVTAPEPYVRPVFSINNHHSAGDSEAEEEKLQSQAELEEDLSGLSKGTKRAKITGEAGLKQEEAKENHRMTCADKEAKTGESEERLELLGLRHACVERVEHLSYIPSDLSMSRAHGRLQLLTGPNMGGKSTFLRAVGLASIMAQMGSFVPCRSARLPIVDAVMARAGATDSILRGVSTFMAEMLEVQAMLRGASARSLVLIDELGRGTSTNDGLGIAYAVAKHLAEKVRCFTIFATHFHELTKMNEEEGQEERCAMGAGPTGKTHTNELNRNTKSSVANLHVTAHTEGDKLTMLYQVLPGPSDRSFGIHVAEIAKFPPSIVEMARTKAIELEKAAASSY